MPTDPKVTPPMSAEDFVDKWVVVLAPIHTDLSSWLRAKPFYLFDEIGENWRRHEATLEEVLDEFGKRVTAPLEAEIAALKLELKKWAQVERLDPAGCITGLTKRAEVAETENTVLKARVAELKAKLLLATEDLFGDD